MPEVRKQGHIDSPKTAGPVTQCLIVVRRVAEPDVAERRLVVEIVDAHRARSRQAGLDAVPGWMCEIEGNTQPGIERPEDQLDHSLVASADQLRTDRPEPVAERTHARAELRELARTVAGQLRREGEPRRRLLGPALELLLGREPVAGGVQLDGGEAPRVEAKELLRVGARRVEARFPGRIRPAGGADMDHG